jgi:hypothetical protein
MWSLGQQITFWRLSPAVPAGSAALAAEVEDVLEAGEDSKFEQALEAEIEAEAATANANGNGSGPKPKHNPTHSRSKKKKRSRSRR